MKKIVSILSVMIVFGGFVDARADSDTATQIYATCTEGKCWIAERSMVLNGGCEGKQAGDSCRLAGAKTARCVSVAKNSAEPEEKELTCEAIECNSGYMMWVSNGRSMGVCHKKDICQHKGNCESKCGVAGVCEPELLKTEVKGFLGVSISGDAYEACYCVNKSMPDKVKCSSGKCMFESKRVVVTCDGGIKKDLDVKPFSVEPSDTPADIARIIDKTYANEIEKICKGKAKSIDFGESKSVNLSDMSAGGNNSGAVAGADKGTNSDSQKISAARDRLAEFFNKVDSDRSVWKNADGSFNGVRLASDLTAGVVLGTVGGVVSGVLIKKSQVEKGFDALNCTVGGQKIADWGDEFTVGLRR